MGRVPACLPISSRKRTVVRLRRPHALSLSVNALRHRMHQKRRLCSTNSTICPRNGTSRLQRGRTSCCLTHIVPQCGHFSPFFVAITSTRSFPSACTSCLRIHRLSNSKGTMIPCVWLGSSSVICWLGIACPPGLLGVLFLPNPTKDKLVVQFSSNFTLKDGEPDYTQAAFIFDEIHAYDPGRLAIILCLIKHLREHYWARFFIMSATFPSILQDILSDVLDIQEPIVAEQTLFEEFGRHHLQMLDGNLLEQGIDRITTDVQQGKSVLVCCNTVQRAQDTHAALF